MFGKYRKAHNLRRSLGSWSIGGAEAVSVLGGKVLGLGFTWTPRVYKLVAQAQDLRRKKKAPKAMILHPFGVQPGRIQRSKAPCLGFLALDCSGCRVLEPSYSLNIVVLQFTRGTAKKGGHRHHIP